MTHRSSFGSFVHLSGFYFGENCFIVPASI